MKPSTDVRVLHIVEVLHVDGRTTLLGDLIKNVGPGVEHTILSMKWPGPRVTDFSSMGIPVFSLGFHRPFSNIAQKVAATSAARKVKPDVCLCWSGGANIVSLIPWLFGTPVIWTIHNSIEQWQGLKERLGIALLARLSRIVPSRVVCCSPATHRIYQEVHKFDARRLLTIENGVDTTKFQPDNATRIRVRDALGITQDKVVVATSARVSGPDYKSQGDFKDLETLLTSVRIACARHPNIRFVMFGSNIDHANTDLVELLRRLQIEPFVILLGVRSDVAKLLTAADLYAMSSVSGEGLPLALLEAMACGLIPVCTDSGGIRDAMGNLGAVVAQKDSAALADAICSLANMDVAARTDLSAAIVRHVRAHFSIGMVAQRYRSLLLETSK